jgi:hypothetical protein
VSTALTPKRNQDWAVYSSKITPILRKTALAAQMDFLGSAGIEVN